MGAVLATMAQLPRYGLDVAIRSLSMAFLTDELLEKRSRALCYVNQRRKELWSSKHGRKLAAFVAKESGFSVLLTIHAAIASDASLEIALTNVAGDNVCLFDTEMDAVFDNLKGRLYKSHPYLDGVVKFLLPSELDISNLKPTYPLANFAKLDDYSISLISAISNHTICWSTTAKLDEEQSAK